MSGSPTDPARSLALVSRLVDYGDADRVVTLLSERHGKVAALARGARRSRRRFGAALDLFVLGEASLKVRHGARSMPLLERFDPVEDLSLAITGDVITVAHGSYMLELARELWPSGQEEPELFRAIVAALRALAARRGTGPCVLLLRAFELRVLGAMGLAPSLERCVHCGADVGTSCSLAFSVAHGGVVCGSCEIRGLPLREPTRSALRTLRQLDLAEVCSLELDPVTTRELRDLGLMLVGHHLGKRLRTLDFIVSL